MTPGPTDLHRPPAYTSIGGDVTNQLDQLTLKTAALRRESAPGGVFAANASTSHPMVSIGPNSGTNLISQNDSFGHNLTSTSTSSILSSTTFLRENIGKSNVTGGGTMPKMSMSILRENNNRNGVTNKFGSPNIVGSKNIDLVGGGGPNNVTGNNTVGTGHNNSNTFNSYMDDSIGSFMGS